MASKNNPHKPKNLDHPSKPEQYREQEQERLFVGQVPLSEAALEIFKALRVAKPHFSADGVATMAFQDALAFVKEESRIRNGGDIAVPIPASAAPVVPVHKWHPVTNEPLRDNHGHPVIEEVRGDPFARADNLPAGHPINQRYWKACVELGIPLGPDAPLEMRKMAASYKNERFPEPSAN